MIYFLQAFRKSRLRVFCGFAILLFAGCLGTVQPRISQDPVKVALLLPFGSDQVGDIVVAQNLQNAAQMAANDLSGVEIDITVYPTARDAEQARDSAIIAVSEGAEVILGPLFSETAKAVSTAVAASGVPVLAFTNDVSVANRNTFILGNTFQNSAEILTRYAVERGNERVYLVHSRNAEGQAGLVAMQEAVREAGLMEAGITGYDFTNEGVVGAIDEIVTGLAQSEADTIFLTSNAAGALPLFAQLLPEAGVTSDKVQYMGLARWDIQQLREFPGIQGGWFVLPDLRRTTAFSSRYRLNYGRAPHSLAGLAYDGIAAIGVIAAQGNQINLASLTQGAGFQGTGGIFRFRADGTLERGLVVATVEDGEVIVLKAAPTRFGGGS